MDNKLLWLITITVRFCCIFYIHLSQLFFLAEQMFLEVIRIIPSNIIIDQMSQRHYSPDQVVSPKRNNSNSKNKRLRQGGSTSKFLESGSRFCQDQINIGDYKYKKSNEIGAGYSSHVYKGVGKDKQEVAVKVIDMRKFTPSGLEMLENEIEILKNLSHPNIIKLYYVYKTQTHTYLVTELCKGGDMLEFMTKKGKFSEQAAAAIMADVIEGTKYLLQMGVIHRDIKPANILRSDKVWKIADFGFSMMGREQVKTRQNVGTPLYMPIESLLKNIYSPQSDIFAVGVMYYELLVGVTPWQCRSQKELIKKLATTPFSIPEKYKLSSSIKFLLNKMCSVDKSTRMQKQEFLQLNIKNFVSLHNFNEPVLTSSKRMEESKRSTANPSPANKIKRSKSKSKPMSKEKGREKEYKLGRRKKSTEKPEGRKKSVQREHVAAKTFTQREEGSTFASMLPESDINVDRFQIINEKILTNQLDFCRFMYYLIQNSKYLPLGEQTLQKVTMVLFKHLIKLIKQLVDIKNNPFKLPHWDSFKQSQRCKNILATFTEYLEKYEKEYLKHLKEANIVVIKDINQKYSQLGSVEPLSVSYYRKVQALIAPALKQALLSPLLQVGDKNRGYMEGVRCLMQYYKWIELSSRHHENYVLQKNLGIQVVKHFKNSEIAPQTFAALVEEIKGL